LKGDWTDQSQRVRIGTDTGSSSKSLFFYYIWITAVPHYKVDIHIEEAKLNEDKNAVTITPILEIIHSIQPTATHEEDTEIILDTSVFVIGFYVGKRKLGDISSFLSELIGEFRRLSPLNSDSACIQGR
jgi:hypothetical protein